MHVRQFYVYIMASHTGTLYIGFTNDLERRARDHKQGIIAGFTKKYGCNRLVYYEAYEDVRQARRREREIKKWNRKKKQDLIKTTNPHWRDLNRE